MHTCALPDSLTVYNAPDVKAALLAALASADSGLELDASATAELDTAGTQILLALAKESARRGIALRLRHPAPRVIQILDLIGVTKRFDIVSAVGGAQ